jgi:DICT domain-containing protein
MLQGSILQKLATAHDPTLSPQRPLSFGVYYKNTLVSLCHALEDCILECDRLPLVITAFQRGKWYLQEADRYAELADKSHQVVIMAADDAGFAEHPTSQKPNVDVVALQAADGAMPRAFGCRLRDGWASPSRSRSKILWILDL